MMLLQDAAGGAVDRMSHFEENGIEGGESDQYMMAKNILFK